MKFGKTIQEQYEEKKRIIAYKDANRGTTKQIFAWFPIKANDDAWYWLVHMIKFSSWDNYLGYDLNQKHYYWPSEK